MFLDLTKRLSTQHLPYGEQTKQRCPWKESPSTVLLNLPTELLLYLETFLSLASLVALRLTHPLFHYTLARPDLSLKALSELDNCARIAIITHYSEFGSHRLMERRCALCKQRYPASYFPVTAVQDWGARIPTDQIWKRSIFLSRIHTQLPEVSLRVCKWHQWLLYSDLAAPLLPRSRTAMYTQEETLCLHCGTFRSRSGCTCDCDSCGTRAVKTYARVERRIESCGTTDVCGDGK